MRGNLHAKETKVPPMTLLRRSTPGFPIPHCLPSAVYWYLRPTKTDAKLKTLEASSCFLPF